MKEIQLTRGKVALVDDEDFAELNKIKWWAGQERGGVTYAQGWIKETKSRRRMHQILINAPKGMQIDHKDGNGLNNQRENLRLASTGSNMQNRGATRFNKSGFKRVRWNKKDKRWTAFIRCQGKDIFLGNYTEPEPAYLAYCLAAHELHGEFAHA